MKKLLVNFLVATLLIGCSNGELESSIEENNGLRSVTDDTGVTVERLNFFGGIDYTGFYVDEPGNIYGMYSKTYLDLITLSGESQYISMLPYEEEGKVFVEIPEYPVGMCLDINRNWYVITSQNYLLKIDYREYVYPNIGPDKYEDLTSKFPANTVFLGITASHDNTNIFVSTAQGAGSNPHDSYTEQTIYRIAANGNVTEVNRIDALVSPNPVVSYSNGEEYPIFPYTSIISKSKGAFVYGLSANGNYYKASTMNNEVTYYPARVPLQHLTAVTGNNNPIGLSGRNILELRPNVNTDLLIATIPDWVEGDPVLLMSNGDATIFYVVMLFEKLNSAGNAYPDTALYRIRVTN